MRNIVAILCHWYARLTEPRWRTRTGLPVFDQMQRSIELAISGWKRRQGRYAISFALVWRDRPTARGFAHYCAEYMPDLCCIEILSASLAHGWLVRGVVSNMLSSTEWVDAKSKVAEEITKKQA